MAPVVPEVRPNDRAIQGVSQSGTSIAVAASHKENATTAPMLAPMAALVPAFFVKVLMKNDWRMKKDKEA
jgi:hypothetical protein